MLLGALPVGAEDRSSCSRALWRCAETVHCLPMLYAIPVDERPH